MAVPGSAARCASDACRAWTATSCSVERPWDSPETRLPAGRAAARAPAGAAANRGKAGDCNSRARRRARPLSSPPAARFSAASAANGLSAGSIAGSVLDERRAAAARGSARGAAPAAARGAARPRSGRPGRAPAQGQHVVLAVGVERRRRFLALRRRKTRRSAWSGHAHRLPRQRWHPASLGVGADGAARLCGRRRASARRSPRARQRPRRPASCGARDAPRPARGRRSRATRLRARRRPRRRPRRRGDAGRGARQPSAAV